jgi:hypothetical protein
MFSHLFVAAFLVKDGQIGMDERIVGLELSCFMAFG